MSGAGGGGERAASELQVPFLGRVPIEPQVVQSTDSGTVLDEAEGASRKVFQDLVRGIRQRVEGSEGDED